MEDKRFKILVKFPTRSRPEKCYDVIKRYIEYSADPENIKYFITYDNDDKTMSEDVRNKISALHNNIEFIGGYSANKIHACNRGMDKQKDWDIVILGSDDMICETRGWDKIIREKIQEYFPDTDGCLWFHDGDAATLKGGLCTMCIIGRKYYKRFNYIYHPSYLSLWCDNEFTEVATQLSKLKFFEQILFRHVHFSNTPNLPIDALMKKTQSLYNIDKGNYFKRKRLNFEMK